MKIVELKAVGGMGGWYCDDKAAFVRGVEVDNYLVRGEAVTPGFRAVREVGEALCVMGRLADGRWALGDCMGVTYGGIAGRDAVFRADAGAEALNEVVMPALGSREFESFREADEFIGGLTFEGAPLHTGLRYGLSQMLLEAFSLAGGCTKAEVIAREFSLTLERREPAIGIQSGDDRYNAVDKAIYRRVGAFPHGLIKNVEKDLGAGGEKLIEYARWIRGRLDAHGVEETYRPRIHFDLYGTIGALFDDDAAAMAGYLSRLAEAVRPLVLQAESPVERDTRDGQIESMAALRGELAKLGGGVVLIADEWCNTLEDVRAFCRAGSVDMIQIKLPDMGVLSASVEAAGICRENGVGIYLGGSCNETDVSARTAVNVAVAVGAEQILARPGMGVDEGVMIMTNELARLDALLFG